MLQYILKFRDTFFWKILLKIQETILIVCTIACVLILCAEVVLRYVFQSDLFGYEEILVIFSMWMYFLGASYAMYQKTHINADMVSLFLQKRQKALSYVKILVSLITTIIAIVLVAWASKFFVWAITKNGTSTSLRIPLLYSQSALLIGYILIAFYSLFYTIEDTVLLFLKRKHAA